MEPIRISHAYYVKLGQQGKWADSSIKEDRVRIGWSHQSLEDINNKNWSVIGNQLMGEVKTKGKVTQDLNMIKTFVNSGPTDIWITFHDSCLWWCHLDECQVEQDEVSKYRKLQGHWSNCDIAGNLLITERIPGNLYRTQGYRSTICRVKHISVLERVLNNQGSPAYKQIIHAQERLVASVQLAFSGLHWKDFENLVEQLFSRAGWHRISRIGETMKYADIVFEEPVTKELYQVQVKSEASAADFRDYADQFSSTGFRKMYFVVHTPRPDLLDLKRNSGDVELVLPERLAEMVVDMGLVRWLLTKTK